MTQLLLELIMTMPGSIQFTFVHMNTDAGIGEVVLSHDLQIFNCLIPFVFCYHLPYTKADRSMCNA